MNISLYYFNICNSGEMLHHSRTCKIGWNKCDRNNFNGFEVAHVYAQKQESTKATHLWCQLWQKHGPASHRYGCSQHTHDCGTSDWCSLEYATFHPHRRCVAAMPSDAYSDQVTKRNSIWDRIPSTSASQINPDEQRSPVAFFGNIMLTSSYVFDV